MREDRGPRGNCGPRSRQKSHDGNPGLKGWLRHADFPILGREQKSCQPTARCWSSSIGAEIGGLGLVPARTMRATAAECLLPATSQGIRKHLRDHGVGAGVAPDLMTKRAAELVGIRAGSAADAERPEIGESQDRRPRGAGALRSCQHGYAGSGQAKSCGLRRCRDRCSIRAAAAPSPRVPKGRTKGVFEHLLSSIRTTVRRGHLWEPTTRRLRGRRRRADVALPLPVSQLSKLRRYIGGCMATPRQRSSGAQGDRTRDMSSPSSRTSNHHVHSRRRLAVSISGASVSAATAAEG